jgi:hypothetical protein
LIKDFEKLDLKYGSLEKMDAAIEKLDQSEFKFLNEMPAKQTTEVTDKLLEIINKS